MAKIQRIEFTRALSAVITASRRRDSNLDPALTRGVLYQLS
jgi:hypothetical protein